MKFALAPGLAVKPMELHKLLSHKGFMQPPIIDGLQYCNWSEKIFRQMRQGGVDAVHVTICYHENFRETVNTIEAWNRRFVGLAIDMSHSAERSTLEAIDLSARPIAITHANPAFWHAARRNKSDAVLKALAARGGMFGFSVYPHHLTVVPPARSHDRLAQ